MKKSLSILVLSILFISILISAQTTTTQEPGTSTTTEKLLIPKINTKDPTPKIDEKLEEEITIPTGLKTITRIGLGINSQEPIPISNLIIVIALWTFVLIASYSTLKSIQTISQIAVSISAFCITMIIGSTKAFSVATEKWLENEDIFIFINGWEFGNLLITIFALVIVGVVVFWLKEKIKKEIERDQKEEALDTIAEEAKSRLRKK
ncbi:MAG: hypothetical protein AABW71_03130 [Nanoarchaeota archaeon]